MGDRRISHALSEGLLFDRSDPLFGVGTHTASAGKPVEGKLTTPKWERRLASLQNSLIQRPSQRPTPPYSRGPLEMNCTRGLYGVPRNIRNLHVPYQYIALFYTKSSLSTLNVAFFVFTDLLQLPLIYFSARPTNESNGRHLGDVNQ